MPTSNDITRTNALNINSFLRCLRRRIEREHVMRQCHAVAIGELVFPWRHSRAGKAVAQNFYGMVEVWLFQFKVRWRWGERVSTDALSIAKLAVAGGAVLRKQHFSPNQDLG